MNENQKRKLFEIFFDEIIKDKEVRAKGPFSFSVYSSSDSSKMVIKCISKEDTLASFFVIDYVSQEYLPECSGINGDNEKFHLNCELDGWSPQIFYTINTDLTTEFNDYVN